MVKPNHVVISSPPWDPNRRFFIQLDFKHPIPADFFQCISITYLVYHSRPTIPGQPFISTSFGYDNFSLSSENWNITTDDTGLCTEQSVDAVHGTDSIFSIQGSLGGSNECESINYALQFSTATGLNGQKLTDRLAFNLTLSSNSPKIQVSRTILSFSSKNDEDFCGFGEQASFSTMKNQVVPIFTREGGIGRGDEPLTSFLNNDPSLGGAFAGGSKFTSYSAIPQYVTTENNLFYITGTAFTQSNFTKPEVATVRYSQAAMLGHFTQGENMLDAVSKYTTYAGKQPSLPKWVDKGAILGIQGGKEKVEGIVAIASTYNCPTAGVFLQDWCGTFNQLGPYVNISRLWWNWEPDQHLYSNWTHFVNHLNSTYGARTLNYVNTFLTNVDNKPSGYVTNLYEIATKEGYLINNSTNQTQTFTSGPGLTAGILDLANPVTYNWFKNIMKKQVWKTGVSGFMSDFGEYQPIANTIINNSRTDPFLYHNSYPADWARLQREVILERNLENEAVVFHRSAGIRSASNMNVMWNGDQDTSWGVNDGIKSVVTSALSVGFSGIGASYCDIGGFTNALSQYLNITRSTEMLGRWGELGAFGGAIFRSHEGLIPSVNAQFYSNASTFTYYAYNARMFASLAPYRRRILDEEVSGLGYPLVRHTVVYNRGDLTLRNTTYESFYLGSKVYVAPVLDPALSKMSVYLPQSEQGWLHVWSNATYKGAQKADIDTPYGQPGVFIKLPREPGHGLNDFMTFVEVERGTSLSII